MRHFTPHRTAWVALTLLCVAGGVPAAPLHGKPRPPAGKLVRTIDSRATVFYEYRTKDGKYHKMAAVSKPVLVKVVKPARPAAP